MRTLTLFLGGMVACSSSTNQAQTDSGGGGSNDGGGGGDAATRKDGSVGTDGSTSGMRTIFVIPLENEPSSKIYGNTTDAPYINSLLATAASAAMFQDELPSLDSEPHYVWMEAGTNAFGDRTFTTDSAPSATNSTTSTAHLVTQLDTAHIPWMSYQQGITSGTCPIAASGVYAPKHDPFIFFKDVSGNPPSASAPLCSAHHKSYSDFAHDLQTGVSGYIFITPDLCHDMHGDAQCPQGTAVAGNIQAGDTFLSTELPAIINYTHTHDALIFLTWDEGDATNLIPFIAIGTHVKAGVNSTVYNHGSMIKSIEEYLGAPILPSVAGTNDFAGMFAAGTFP
jgi:hypothetical protein